MYYHYIFTCVYIYIYIYILSYINLKKFFTLFPTVFRDILATTCEDQKVRVYYLATATDKPLKVFSG